MEENRSSRANGSTPDFDQLADDQERGDQNFLSEKLAEIVEFFSCYVEAKLERGRLRIRRLMFKIAVAMVAVLFVALSLLIALGFIFYGVSLGLAEAFGQRLWLGYVSSGLLFSFLVLGVTLFKQRRWAKKSVQRKIKIYEEKLAKQRAKFGRNLEEQAAAFSQK